MKPLYSLLTFFTVLIIISKLPLENFIYEPIFCTTYHLILSNRYLDTLDGYFKLAEALEHQSFTSLVSERVISLSQGIQEQAVRASEKLAPMFKVLQEQFSALNRQTESSNDIGKDKSRFNFASVNGGAKIVATKPSAKIGKAILVDDNDK